MKALLNILCYAALIGTVLPAFFYLGGQITLEQVKLTMLIATVVWFVSSTVRQKLADG